MASAQLFAVIRTRGPAWDGSRPLDSQPDWAGHAVFMNGLAAEGFVVLGGPLEGTPDVLLVIRARTRDEILARLGADPWTALDLLRVSRVTPWTLRLGTLPPPRDDPPERTRGVWDAMAAGWETGRHDLWAFSRPLSEWMVERIDPRPGETVLDLAAGVGDTGLLAARRVGEAGRVLVTDLAPRMVAAARRRAAELGVTNAEFRELDAQRMDLPSGSVDAVVCRWGYMLMPDPGAALAETHRVLRPGGRLAFSVFGAAERNPWASLVRRILVDEGHLPPPAPGAPGILALSDPARIRTLVTGAGFAVPDVAEVDLTWRFPSRDAYWWFLTDMAGAISPILLGLTPEDRAQVRRHLDTVTEPYRAGEGLAFPTLCLNVATRKAADG